MKGPVYAELLVLVCRLPFERRYESFEQQVPWDTGCQLMREKTKVILGVILFPPFVWYVTRRGIDEEMFIGILMSGSVWVGAVIALLAGAFDNR